MVLQSGIEMARLLVLRSACEWVILSAPRSDFFVGDSVGESVGRRRRTKSGGDSRIVCGGDGWHVSGQFRRLRGRIFRGRDGRTFCGQRLLVFVQPYCVVVDGDARDQVVLANSYIARVVRVI